MSKKVVSSYYPFKQIHIVKLSYLWTYDLYGPTRNAFDAGKSITRASGRGLGPGNRDFLGPVKWHRAVRRVPFGAQTVTYIKSAPVHK